MLVSSISNSYVHTNLFAYDKCTNHIKLAPDCDLFVVATAVANFIARIAYGRADDLASSVLLAKGERPVLLAPLHQ